MPSMRSVVATATAFSLVPLVVVAFATPSPVAVAQSEGAIVEADECMQHVLDRNDDGSTTEVSPGFDIELGGTTYDTLFVNNNGNVSFGQSLWAYTPTELSNVEVPLIAPYWADVDTRPDGSDIVRYGWGLTVYEGRPALCVNWIGVGYYSYGIDKLNSFQLLLVSREDERGVGAFDAVFNYDQVQWETGSASGGTNGLGGESARAGFASFVDDGVGQWWEAAGSGVPGSFLDASFGAPNPLALVGRSMNSDVGGRFVIPFTDGFASDLDEGIDLGEPWLRHKWVGQLAYVEIQGELPAIASDERLRVEIVSGPNEGTEGFRCLEDGPLFSISFCDLLGNGTSTRRFWYVGTTTGTDVIRVWIEDADGDVSLQGFAGITWHDDLDYSALGDSYSSGEGLEDNDDEDYLPGYGNFPKCHRADRGYPALLRATGGSAALTSSNIDFEFLACTGARTYNVVRSVETLRDLSSGELGDSTGPAPGVPVNPPRRQGQMLGEIQSTGDVDLITMTIGGNDAQWTEVVSECFFEASEESSHDCFDGINTYPGTDVPLDQWVENRLEIVASRVRTTVQDLRSIAPRATIVLAGYPQLMPASAEEQECGKLDPTFAGRKLLSKTEQNDLRAYIDRLDDELADLAAEIGIHYVSVVDEFAGHEICGNDGEYLNALSLDWNGFLWDDVRDIAAPDPKSFHPNPKGHEAYARAIEDHLDAARRSGLPITDAGIPSNPAPRGAGLTGFASLAAAAISEQGVEIGQVGVDTGSSCSGRPIPVVAPGGEIQLAVDALAPGSTATVTGEQLLDDEASRPLGEFVADADGRATGSIVVPADIASGDALSAVVVGTTANGAVLSARSALITVATAPPPCLEGDSATTRLDTPVTVSVLDNDVPGAGDWDVDSLSVAADASFGRASASGGTMLYQPRTGWYGTDRFAYRVCRDDQVCGRATVEVTVDPGCTIFGTDGDNEITGTPGDDVICAGDGNDVVVGGEGDDVILGGPGDDLLAGGPGADRLIGGDGHDAFSADGGDIIEEEPGEPVDGSGDDVPPTVAIARPTDGEQVILGSEVTVSYSCDDNVELASCTGPIESGGLLATSEPGPHEFTVTAVDAAGNATVSTVVYRVVYVGSDLGPPLKPAPEVTSAKAGRTIPLKWGLSSADGPVDDAASFGSVTTSQVPCDQPVTGEAVWEDGTDRGGLQYLGDGNWQYNLVTLKSWAGTCRVVNVELADRTSRLATISFR